MFNFLKKLIEKVTPPPIKIGGKYRFIDDSGDPFPRKDGHLVIVLDVKQGWVRYRWAEGDMWQDQRMEEWSFRLCYFPIHEE
ncbi:hypothetical protein C4565_00760 [Candidatus Parcubacteria bacterium]|nr:MAG: hypothetical protein C4565_00760 [Candidatus Parcubacteria bacterium]